MTGNAPEKKAIHEQIRKTLRQYGGSFSLHDPIFIGSRPDYYEKTLSCVKNVNRYCNVPTVRRKIGVVESGLGNSALNVPNLAGKNHIAVDGPFIEREGQHVEKPASGHCNEALRTFL